MIPLDGPSILPTLPPFPWDAGDEALLVDALRGGGTVYVGVVESVGADEIRFAHGATGDGGSVLVSPAWLVPLVLPAGTKVTPGPTSDPEVCRRTIAPPMYGVVVEHRCRDPVYHRRVGTLGLVTLCHLCVSPEGVVYQRAEFVRTGDRRLAGFGFRWAPDRGLADVLPVEYPPRCCACGAWGAEHECAGTVPPRMVVSAPGGGPQPWKGLIDPIVLRKASERTARLRAARAAMEALTKATEMHAHLAAGDPVAAVDAAVDAMLAIQESVAFAPAAPIERNLAAEAVVQDAARESVARARAVDPALAAAVHAGLRERGFRWPAPPVEVESADELADLICEDATDDDGLAR